MARSEDAYLRNKVCILSGFRLKWAGSVSGIVSPRKFSVRADVWEPGEPRSHQTAAKLAVFKGVILEAPQNIAGLSTKLILASTNCTNEWDILLLFCYTALEMLIVG